VIIPDVNLLLYAVFTGYPQHSDARGWWEQSINSRAEIGLPHPVIFGLSASPRTGGSTPRR
jgi:predicted nucleic acid-binding protein